MILRRAPSIDRSLRALAGAVAELDRQLAGPAFAPGEPAPEAIVKRLGIERQPAVRQGQKLRELAMDLERAAFDLSRLKRRVLRAELELRQMEIPA